MATAGDENPPDPSKETPAVSRDGDAMAQDITRTQHDHLITEIESADGHLGSTLRYGSLPNVARKCVHCSSFSSACHLSLRSRKTFPLLLTFFRSIRLGNELVCTVRLRK